MPEIENAVVQEFETPQQSNGKDFKSVIRNLIANGATRINKVRVKNVTVDTEWEEKGKSFCAVNISLDREIPGYVSKDNGITFEKGMTNVIYLTSFSIAGFLKETEEWAWLANHVVEHPECLTLIFTKAELDILQIEYPQGTVITNPFSTRDDNEGKVYDHNVITNNVINIVLSKMGEKFAMRVADAKLVG